MVVAEDGPVEHAVTSADLSTTRIVAPGAPTRPRAWLIPLSTAVIASVFYTLVSLRRFNDFFSGKDLAIFGQSAKSYSEGHMPFSLIKGRGDFNLLGDHFSPILAVMGPLYKLWPDVRMLLVAQAILFGVGVFLLGMFATRYLPRRYSTLVVIAFALSWGVIGTVGFDFHEIAFAVPFLILATEAALKSRWGWLTLWCFMLMLTKEDSAFLVAGIALLLLARRHIKAGLILGAASVAAFTLVVLVAIPHFSYSGQFTYFSVLDGDAQQQSMLGIVTENLTSQLFLTFAAVIILTLGIGLTSPVALVLIPTVLSRLVSSHHVYFEFGYHYNATLMVACFMALIDAWAKLRTSTLPARRIAWISAAQICLLAAVTAFSMISTGALYDATHVTTGCERCHQLQAAADAVPDGVTIISDPFISPHLVDRAEVMAARITWSDATKLPLHADWVILNEDSPEADNPSNGWVLARVERLKAEGFVEYFRDGPVVILHKP